MHFHSKIHALKGIHSNDHCYDPNEEAQLRHVIDAVGASHFNSKIHAWENRACSGDENALDAAGRDADDDDDDAENDDDDATEAKEEDFSAGMDGVVPTIGVVDGDVERHFFSRHDN